MQILSCSCKSTVCKYCAEVLRNNFSVTCVNYKNLINILNMLVTLYFPEKRKYFFNFVSKMQLFCTANNPQLFCTINNREYRLCYGYSTLLYEDTPLELNCDSKRSLISTWNIWITFTIFEDDNYSIKRIILIANTVRKAT